MFVRILKECRCTHSFWHDRHWGDRWKDDDWVKLKRPETLKAGQVIEAAQVRPSAKCPGRCRIVVAFMAGMNNCYAGVPWNCIEILDRKPAKAGKK